MKEVPKPFYKRFSVLLFMIFLNMYFMTKINYVNLLRKYIFIELVYNKLTIEKEVTFPFIVKISEFFKKNSDFTSNIYIFVLL